MRNVYRHMLIFGAVGAVVALITLISYLRHVVGPRELAVHDAANRRNAAYDLYLFSNNLRKRTSSIDLPWSDLARRGEVEAEIDALVAPRADGVIVKDVQKTLDRLPLVVWRFDTPTGHTALTRMWVVLFAFQEESREACLICAGAIPVKKASGYEYVILVYSPVHKDQVFQASLPSLDVADEFVAGIANQIDPCHCFVKTHPWSVFVESQTDFSNLPVLQRRIQ